MNDYKYKYKSIKVNINFFKKELVVGYIVEV